MLIQGLLAASLVLAGSPAAAVQAKVDCAKVKCLALTFDDGPGTTTPALLDLLKKERVKATFFVVGRRVAERPSVAKRIVTEGHAIGNHTYAHPWLTRRLDEDIIRELQSTQETVKDATGVTPTLFRPPYGRTDERVLHLASQYGLAQVMWTGTTLDWDLRDAKKIKAAVLRLAKRDGVLLMHDTVPQTVKAMPGIVRELKKRGYHLVTVPTLAGAKRLKSGTSYP